MALTAAQIVNLACGIAKTPGMIVQAGQMLNAILDELARDFDFQEGALSSTVFNFNPSSLTTSVYPNIQPGGGPYALPADFLRIYGQQWYLLGVAYPMIPCDLKEYDLLVQQAGLQSYPYIFATDMSQSPPNLVIWPPASGTYQCLIRYYSKPAEIATPQTSSAVPWFPLSSYLYTRLAGEMMKISGDGRWQAFIGDADPDKDQPGSAASMLRSYLKMRDDKSDRSQTVKLDRRRFSKKFSLLRNTKTVGW